MEKVIKYINEVSDSYYKVYKNLFLKHGIEKEDLRQEAFIFVHKKIDKNLKETELKKYINYITFTRLCIFRKRLENKHCLDIELVESMKEDLKKLDYEDEIYTKLKEEIDSNYIVNLPFPEDNSFYEKKISESISIRDNNPRFNVCLECIKEVLTKIEWSIFNYRLMKGRTYEEISDIIKEEYQESYTSQMIRVLYLGSLKKCGEIVKFYLCFPKKVL